MLPHYRPLLLSSVILCVFVSLVYADPTTPAALHEEEKLLLQEIPSVYTASKYTQKVTDAPASVSIITAEEIKKFGYRTVADILRSVRGFYISYDRNYSYVGVRGFSRPGDYNTRTLLLLDGHRINENIYDSAYVGNEAIIDVDLIDRVEIVRGPSSSLYGSDAFFGVVNIITKRGRDVQGAEVSGEVGLFDTYKGRLSAGYRMSNAAEGLWSASYGRSEGPPRLYFKEFDDPATNHGIAAYGDGEEWYSIFGKLTWGGLTLQGATMERDKENPTGSWGTVFNNPRNRTRDGRSYVSLQYTHRFDEHWQIMGRLFYDHYYYDGDYLYDVPPLVLNKDIARGESWGSEVQVVTTALPRQTITLGAEYYNHFRQDIRNFDQRPFFSYFDEQQRSHNWAVYLQDEVTLLPYLTLSLGLRHDQYGSFGGTTNPRLGLIARVHPETTVKLLYGRAFRAPSFNESFSAGPSSSLQPETITTYEAVLEQTFGPSWRGTLTGFHYRIDKLINQTVVADSGAVILANLDEVQASGIELELEGRWSSGWAGRFSYTYQDTTDQRTGKRLSNSPRHLAKFHLTVPVLEDKLFAGLEMQYTGGRTTLANRTTDDFLLTNVTLFSQHVFKGLEISATIYNLFDIRYSDPGAVQHLQDALLQDGRSFRVKLTYGF